MKSPGVVIKAEAAMVNDIITGRVIKNYTSPYTKPWSMRKGEALQVGKRDSEWEGWIWCTNARNECRWVPENYLDIVGQAGVAKIDYESTELEVNVGEILALGEQESDWCWCTNQEGMSGWVPMENLAVY
jgi:hypothetical protein